MTFGTDQRTALKAASPANVSATMDAFGYRAALVPKVGSKASTGDFAIDFVKPGAAEAKEISRVLLKELDKARYTANRRRRHHAGDRARRAREWRGAPDPAEGRDGHPRQPC